MKTKLIQTKEYLLLIDEEAEIKEGDYRFHIYEKTLNLPVHRLEHGENTFDSWKLVIAYYPLTKEAKELDLPLLPKPNPFEGEGTAEKLAELEFPYPKGMFPYHNGGRVNEKGYTKEEVWLLHKGYLSGYKAAQSDKQFSLEDIKKAWEDGRNGTELIGNFPYQQTKWINKNLEEFIQSLSTQQSPKEFVPEYINTNSFGSETNGYDSGNFILKTAINSEGKEVLTGKWVY